MNSDFPRILTLLRRERGISQKEAAGSLLISQALLSHYEKGIRECGLDFIVRTANFYNVSCDFLLGRSPERTGAQLSVNDLPEPDVLGKENNLKGSILPTLNKKLISNSLNIIFDVLQNVNNKDLTLELSCFLNLSVYRVFRILYGINPKNEQTLFTVSPSIASAKALALMIMSEANANAIATELSSISHEQMEDLYISTETLQKNYPLFTTSLLNLIKNSEGSLNS